MAIYEIHPAWPEGYAGILRSYSGSLQKMRCVIHYNMNSISDHTQRVEPPIPCFPLINLYGGIGVNGGKMIKKADLLKPFEDELVKKSPRSSLLKSLSLFEAMWKEGIHFVVLPPSDFMEGIEVAGCSVVCRSPLPNRRRALKAKPSKSRSGAK
jgi:hypothetical protein